MYIPFPDSDIETSLVQRFEKIVALVPDQPALLHAGENVSYGELNRRANQLAHIILKLLGKESEPVALVCEHGLAVVVGIWAVLKAGKFYTSIPVAGTQAEQSHLLTLVQPRLLITDNHRLDEALAIANADQKILNLDRLDQAEEENIPLRFELELPAALFYTSGSTGQPKGVIRGHRMLLHHYHFEITRSQVSTDDRLSFIHDCAFAGSNPEIFRSLLAGATLCPFDLRSMGLSLFLDRLQETRITCFQSPVPLFHQIVDLLPDKATLPHLRLLSLGGEKVYSEEIRRFWQKLTTPCTIHHSFSSSESGLLTSEYFQPGDLLPGDVLPASFPIPGKEIQIVDEMGKPVPPGESGEIVVTSRYMAVGYWRNPTLTAQRFSSDPEQPTLRTYATGDLGRFRPDGRLEHLGRKDAMVKVRGYQVNLNEVENLLRGIDGVEEAAVVAYTLPENREIRIAAYLQQPKESRPTAASLRQTLARRIPEYMIPSFFTWLEHFPLTASGKIDRKGLPAPNRLRPDLPSVFAAAQTPIEKELVQIWQETLGLDGIGVHDKFLDLEGHSLNAIQIVSRLLSQFQVEIPLPALFASPTIAEMALVITAHQMQLLSPEELDRILTELKATNEITHLA